MSTTKDDLNNTVTAAVMEAVAIEPLALEEEFIRVPTDLAYWNAQYARAYKMHLRKKHESERMYAKLMMKTRSTAELKGEKLSVDGIKAVVEASEEWNTAKLEAIEAEGEKVRLYGVVSAVIAKKEALISIGAHIRAEMGNDPRIREQARGRRDVEASKRADMPHDRDED